MSEPIGVMARIAADAAVRNNISVAQIRGGAKTGEIVLARWECYKEAYESGFSLPQIGRFFNRDHTTVLYGLRRMGVLHPGRMRPLVPFNRNPMPSLDATKTDQALRMWRNGLDTKDIADRLSVSEASVYNSLSNTRGVRHGHVAARERRDAEETVG